MNDYFTFYVKHFELPLCMKCAIQINLPCLALLAHLLGYFKNEKDLSIWQPKAEKKQEKEEKRKHDRGKLSDGDKIDLMIII